MNGPIYPFTYNTASLCFDFDSISDQRIIRKRIQYLPTDVPKLYNLALGDLLPNGMVSDTVRSNNQDRDKVMATVVQTLLLFFKQRPDHFVIFQRSTDSRNRLYRIAISRELDQPRKMFDIFRNVDGPTARTVSA